MPKETNWTEETDLVLSVLEATELVKSVKWGAEVFSINNRNIISYLGFKNHFAIWFYDGVFLQDKYKVLTSSSNKTKAMRKWQVTNVNEFNPKWLKEYVNEAIKNAKEGKVWQPQISTEITIPLILTKAFKENKSLKTKFNLLAKHKQKEYIEHVTSAKKEETNLARLNKVIPIIMEGKGLNDKYK